MTRPSALPGQCRSLASWNGETWHYCSRMEGHTDFHLSHNGTVTWPVTGDGDPAWTAPWPSHSDPEPQFGDTGTSANGGAE